MSAAEVSTATSGRGPATAAAPSASQPAPTTPSTTAPGPPSVLSDEMRQLFEGHRKLHESILKLQLRIEEEEAAYLEETAHGNIIRGWDGFIDSKPPRKDAQIKKVKPYTEAEHLFSGCCQYATLASEPTLDLVDYHQPRDEPTTGRRRGSASISGASGSNASTSGSTRQTPSSKPGLERKASFSSAASTPVNSATGAGKAPPKMKKRKRLDRLEVASTASATHSETGEDDEPELRARRPREGEDDILDML